MTPEDIAKAGTEHAHQAALFCWANSVKQQYPMLQFMHAIPNGGLRNKVTASRLRAEGVKAGVCDVFLPYPIDVKGVYLSHGLYIEMKKPGKGRVSDAQNEFMAYVKGRGYIVIVCETWLDARNAILTYLPVPS